MPLSSAGRQRTRTRWTTAALIALCATVGIGDLGAAEKPGRGKKVPPLQRAFEAALDAKKPDIVSCVMAHGLNLGAPSVKLDIKVLINRQGQPFGVDLQVTQQGGNKDAMSECVKQAITLTRFPPSKSALTELRRQWTFATQ